MAKPGKSGLKRIIDAAYYSKKGLQAGLKHEAALRQELCLALPLTIIAFFVGNSAVQVLLLILLPWLTFTAEILNSAIEAVVDRIGDEYHELSGRAKDLGSACVFIMLMLTVFVWTVIIGENAGWWSFGS